MKSSAPSPVTVGYEGDFPPEHWYLSDGFMMPITQQTQRREDVIHQTFDAYVAREKRDASILANVALRWDQLHPGVGVDPDIMWVEPALPADLRSVLTWEKGVNPPRIAVEIVGRDTARKDYTYGPQKHGEARVRELWVFDPEGFGKTDAGEGPWVLQVWRARKGVFQRVHAGNGPYFSRELGAWLVVVGDLLRVANDRAGNDLWPTTTEERDRAEARAATAESRIVDETRARADAESRAATAEARVCELEAALARLGK